MIVTRNGKAMLAPRPLHLGLLLLPLLLPAILDAEDGGAKSSKPPPAPVNTAAAIGTRVHYYNSQAKQAHAQAHARDNYRQIFKLPSTVDSSTGIDMCLC